MKKQFLTQTLLALSLCTAMISCQKDVPSEEETNVPQNEIQKSSSQKQNSFYSLPVNVGNGTARTFITLNPSGKPMEMGVELTRTALQGLPSGHGEYAYVIPLPEQAREATPYNHVLLNWNPAGHEPDHVYTVPHFDFHFYRTTIAEREAIPTYDMAKPAFDNFPSPDYLPANYVPTPGGVPQMGKHWVDKNAPELHGQDFTYTFIYGTYNGRVTFTEPMITKAVLESGSKYKLDIPQPATYPVANKYFPKDYNIYTDKGSQRIYVTYSNFKKQ